MCGNKMATKQREKRRERERVSIGAAATRNNTQHTSGGFGGERMYIAVIYSMWLKQERERGSSFCSCGGAYTCPKHLLID